jgi:CheY-like chemotaxis protein
MAFALAPMESNFLILLADDDADTRELYGLSLRMEGFSVDLARDGAEAWDLAQARQPDVTSFNPRRR